MSEPELLILWIAPALFLLIASAKLITEELISLVTLVKKLSAILKSEYSLESGKLSVRSLKDVARPHQAHSARNEKKLSGKKH